jgi:hypothetical protein
VCRHEDLRSAILQLLEEHALPIRFEASFNLVYKRDRAITLPLLRNGEGR